MTPTPSPTPVVDDWTSSLFDSPWFWPVVVALFLALAALVLSRERHD